MSNDTPHGSRPLPDFVKPGLMTMKGGELYLKCAYRVLWFRDDHPDWCIETELLTADADWALARCVIKDDTGGILSTAHKSQSAKQFPGGHIEKAETGAVARALALLGYGTEFGELDEGTLAETAKRARPASATAPGVNKCQTCGVTPATPGTHHRPDCVNKTGKE